MTSKEIFNNILKQLDEFIEYNPLKNPEHPKYKEYKEAMNKIVEKYTDKIIQKHFNK